MNAIHKERSTSKLQDILPQRPLVCTALCARLLVTPGPVTFTATSRYIMPEVEEPEPEPVEVRVRCNIERIMSVDLQTQSFTASVMFEARWRDAQLKMIEDILARHGGIHAVSENEWWHASGTAGYTIKIPPEYLQRLSSRKSQVHEDTHQKAELGVQFFAPRFVLPNMVTCHTQVIWYRFLPSWQCRP